MPKEPNETICTTNWPPWKILHNRMVSPTHKMTDDFVYLVYLGKNIRQQVTIA